MHVTFRRRQIDRQQLRGQKKIRLPPIKKYYGRILTPLVQQCEDTKTLPAVANLAQDLTPRGHQVLGSDLNDEEDMINGEDVSLECYRQKSQRLAEFEIEHNWLLKEEMEKSRKRFERTKKMLTIPLPDEDPIEGIRNRIEEIYSMVKPKIELLDFLKNLSPEQKERVLNLTKMNHLTLKKERRKHWKSGDFLRHAIRMVYVVTCAAYASRRYFYSDDPEAGHSVMKKQRLMYRTKSQQDIKSSLSFELQNILSTNPIARTDEQIKKILWLLKTTKAFQNLFPLEMTKEMARVIAYEKYDHNRHIAYQGRPPDRLYFIISGKIQKLREYKLPSGCLNKYMGSLQKGGMSDHEELESQVIRQDHLVSSGSVEVLVLTKQDYLRLLHTTQGLPVDFLLSIDLFKEFPSFVFETNPASITYKYYCQNAVVCSDVSRTPWLHIVKSGQVKVVRDQDVYDSTSDLLFLNNKEEPGLGKTFSHAKTMLGNLESQRRLRNSEISLPQIIKRRGKASEKTNKNVNLTEQVDHSTDESLTQSADDREYGTNTKPESDFILPAIVVNTSESKPSRRMSSEIKLKGPWSNRSQLSANEQKIENLPQIASESYTKTFLTRDQTTVTDTLPTNDPLKDVTLRKTKVQLDVLNPGDVFGLEDIAEKFRYIQSDSEEGLSVPDIPLNAEDTNSKLSLISDGAEIIRISKRFFLHYARNNTMLRVEIMQRSYLSLSEAKDFLYTKDSWSQYKEALMKRVLSGLVR